VTVTTKLALTTDTSTSSRILCIHFDDLFVTLPSCTLQQQHWTTSEA